MTTYELLTAAGAHPLQALALLGAPVGTALALQLGPSHPSPRSLVAVAWSAAVYASCVPGMLAGALLLYVAAVTRQDLLKLDVTLTLAPVLAMVATLVLAQRKVELSELPGVDRLGGFLMVLGAAMVALIAIDRTRIVMLFHGSVFHVLLLLAVLVVVFRLGVQKLLGPKPPRPEAW